MTDRPTYHARIWRDPDDDAWLVACVEEERAHSCGRSLADARANAVEVIGLWFHLDEGAFDVAINVDLGDMSPLVAQVHRDRETLTGARARLHDAAGRLVDAGLTYRDAAELLGVSYQRVGQLVGRRAG